MSVKRRQYVKERVNYVVKNLFRLDYVVDFELISDGVQESVQRSIEYFGFPFAETLCNSINPNAISAYNYMFDIEDLTYGSKVISEETLLNLYGIRLIDGVLVGDCKYKKFTVNHCINWLVSDFAAFKSIKWQGCAKLEIIKSEGFREFTLKYKSVWLSAFTRLVSIENKQYYFNELAHEIYSILDIPETRNILINSMVKSNITLDEYIRE